jgi:hypothetical protein
MRIIVLLVLSVLFVTSAAHADHEKEKSKALKAAKPWMALADRDKFAETYDDASAYFKGAITKLDWGKQLHGVREPLGALKSRKLKSSEYKRVIQGGPDGEYVVLKFDSSFEQKASALESVTLMKQKDGSWRVAGYFIR